MSDKKVPKIRFPEFTEAWEQRKLGDITSKIGSGKTPLGGKEAYVENGICLIRSQNVYDDRVDLTDVVYIDEETDNSMSNSRVVTGDVLLNITGASIGRSAVYTGLDGANVNQHVCIIRPVDGYEPKYIQLNISSSNGQKQIDSSQAGGGREGLNFQQIGKMTFMFPKLEEQQKIGVFFSTLDTLITLHQRKCDKIKEYKKGCLRKMFPKEGESVPEIRFPGFTEAWEQRKLSKVVDSVDTGKSKFDKEGSSGEYPILGSTSVIGYDHDYDYEGDFILTARVGANAGSLYRYAGKVKISDNTVFIQASQNIEFLYHLLTQFDIKKLSFGTGQPLVKASELKNLELMMPADITEQVQIGDFFLNLDNLITLHQRKCDKYKELKKGLLQQMFV